MPSLEIEKTQAYIGLTPFKIRAPVVFESPHDYPFPPREFNRACEDVHINRQVDYHIGDLFVPVIHKGLPFLRSRVHRGCVIDFNRALRDIHPDHIAGSLQILTPDPDSKYARAGLGLVRTHAYLGSDIRLRDENPSEAEILDKIEHYWQPYHEKLAGMIARIHNQYGRSYHLSCHSFPMEFMRERHELKNTEVILGSLRGESASPDFTDFIAQKLRDSGLSVKVNEILSGAECIRRHSDPQNHRHSLQMEIMRELIMDNHTFKKHKGFEDIQKIMMQLSEDIKDFALSQTPYPTDGQAPDQPTPATEGIPEPPAWK